MSTTIKTKIMYKNSNLVEKKLTHLFSTVDRHSGMSSDQTPVLEIFHGLHLSPPRDLLDKIGLFRIKIVKT